MTIDQYLEEEELVMELMMIFYKLLEELPELNKKRAIEQITALIQKADV